MKKLLFFFWVLSAGLFSACSTSSLSPSDLNSSEAYFPLEKGSFIIYDVEQTDYTFVDGIINRTYQLRELVKDTVTLQGGQIAYQLERAIRTDTTVDVWTIDSIWVAYRTNTQAVRYESSVPFVKLVFPLKRTSNWNGNQLNNNLPDITENWKVTEFEREKVINGRRFDKTITVIHRSDSSCRGKYNKEETYAQGIGLVYKTYTNFTYEETDPPCTPPFNIEVGRYYVERFRRSGKL
ncbi:MAG: hypothetical protein ACOVMN_02650 [Flexibacteraceae bacterium]